MLVEFGKGGWVSKARQQPDKVRLVLQKMRTDGIATTIESVFNKLDQPLPLGYCNVGVAVAVGAGVKQFHTGDRIASNGMHAEVVSAPENLCARVPDEVSDEEAAFTILGAIALQGIRLVAPTLGESVVVVGLGLIGLMTVQLLRAHGCRVLALDFDETRVALARTFGADVLALSAGADPVAAAMAFSRGRGVDAVLITAATQSDEPMHQAAQMSRKRGRIVLVGVAGLNLSRADFFEKELTFQVSCSYGPGRYDPEYEAKGHDYPVGYVRWTEQRNFEAVLDMMSDGRLDVKPLISHRFAIDDADDAYELVAGGAESLGILLTYPRSTQFAAVDSAARTVALNPTPITRKGDAVSVSAIGAGNYATGVLLPALAAAGVSFRTVASSGGVSGAHAGRKFGFERTTTDAESIFHDDGTDAVVITTRHDSHASLTLQALAAEKHTFVEKPLCLTREELDRIEHAMTGCDRILMVGFNRRFAPQVVKIQQLLQSVRIPRAFVMTVNAGALPDDHWTQDPEVGGGRILGEACHFIDLLRFLAGSSIAECRLSSMRSRNHDTVTICMEFEDGSIGTVHYFANGNNGFPKERLEVFTGNAVLQLDNFRKLQGYGWPGFNRMNLRQQDKGQDACVRAFVDAVRTGAAPPIPLTEILEVARLTIDLAQG